MTSFRDICLKGDMNQVLNIVNGRDTYDPNHGLLGACMGGHMDIVKLVIEKGAYDWNNGLRYACLKGYIDIVELMINKGAIYVFGMYNACRAGHRDIINMLIEKHTKRPNIAISLSSNFFNYGLNGACRGGHVDIIKLIIEKGSMGPAHEHSFNANIWRRALYSVCKSGNIDAVVLIIVKGRSSLSKIDIDYGFILACKKGNLNVVKLMVYSNVVALDIKNLHNGLHAGCENGHIDIVRFMIELFEKFMHACGMPFNITYLNTGLLYACNEYVDIVKLMVEKGATNIGDIYSYPRNHDEITKLIELDLPINKLSTIKGIDILINNIRQYTSTIFDELYKYIPKELANNITEFIGNNAYTEPPSIFSRCVIS